MHWSNYGVSGILMMIFMFIFLIVFIAAIVVGIILLIRYLGPSNGISMGRKEDAVEIARNRYARGEISKKEFDQIKNDLSG